MSPLSPFASKSGGSWPPSSYGSAAPVDMSAILQLNNFSDHVMQAKFLWTGKLKKVDVRQTDYCPFVINDVNINRLLRSATKPKRWRTRDEATPLANDNKLLWCYRRKISGPDHPENLIYRCLSQGRSWNFTHAFVSNPANRWTDEQTDGQTDRVTLTKCCFTEVLSAITVCQCLPTWLVAPLKCPWMKTLTLSTSGAARRYGLICCLFCGSWSESVGICQLSTSSSSESTTSGSTTTQHCNCTPYNLFCPALIDLTSPKGPFIATQLNSTSSWVASL